MRTKRLANGLYGPQQAYSRGNTRSTCSLETRNAKNAIVASCTTLQYKKAHHTRENREFPQPGDASVSQSVVPDVPQLSHPTRRRPRGRSPPKKERRCRGHGTQRVERVSAERDGERENGDTLLGIKRGCGRRFRVGTGELAPDLEICLGGVFEVLRCLCRFDAHTGRCGVVVFSEPWFCRLRKRKRVLKRTIGIPTRVVLAQAISSLSL